MRTGNPSFDNAWDFLAEKHPATALAERYNTVEIGQRPKIKNDQDWREYVTALVSVVKIGQRNNWVTLHLDGQGAAMWLTVENQIAEKATTSATRADAKPESE